MNQSFKAKCRQRLQELFSLDVRSLAAMRIAVGLILLADLFERARYLESHYTDFGLIPRSELITHFSSQWTYSIHLLSGNFWIQSGIFLINTFFVFWFLLGYRTRLATVICWFFLLSLHNRNTLILQGGDVLLRLLLFWGIFLPLGARASLDSLRGKEFEGYGLRSFNPQLYLSFASAGLLLQVVLLYVTAAVHKYL